MEFKDYYSLLNVPRTASDDDIKRSYRKLARKYHPDVSKEPNAEEKFKEVQEAYEVLKDPKKRSAYDQLGAQWKSGEEFRPPPNWQDFAGGNSQFEFGGEGGDFSDFFASLFGQARQGGFHRGRQRQEFRQRGNDEHAKIKISLEDAFHGATKSIHFQHKTQTLKVTIPPGVTTGQQLRLANQGSPGIGGAPAGDLYLEIQIEPHAFYTLQGKDVYITLPLTPWEAALGAKIKVPTLAGPVDMKIAANSQTGQKLRLKGRGLPAKPQPGDQYALLQIVTPSAHTDSQRAFYEKMSQEMPMNPREKWSLS
jgi:curved DNA-binding protein